jgi:hypothetical protein
MLPTIEAANLIPLIAQGAIVMEVLNLEVATEPLARNEDMEAALGAGKDAGEQGPTLGSLKGQVAIAGPPTEVFHGAMPLATLVDLLHHLGKLIAQTPTQTNRQSHQFPH